MISQHWFRWWLGAVRQQAITWANVDPNLCRHMASLGPDELITILVPQDFWHQICNLWNEICLCFHNINLPGVNVDEGWCQLQCRICMQLRTDGETDYMAISLCVYFIDSLDTWGPSLLHIDVSVWRRHLPILRWDSHVTVLFYDGNPYIDGLVHWARLQ